MKSYYFVFLVSILLAITTRFYLLGSAPAGLYLDEAAQGYNAYSILKTGRDEFGMLFPAVFRSFADFKTPIYIYLIAPLIPLFGLTAFTVRLPSFLASIITLPIMFYLIKLISPDKKAGNFIGAISCLLLAISPWHILFGRTNFECNVALLFYLSAVYLFYLGLKKPSFLIHAGILFAIALPSYHSERLLVPITIIFFLIRFGKILFDQKHLKYSLIGLLFASIISLPTLFIINTSGFLARISTLSFSSNLPGVVRSELFPSWLINPPFFLKIQELFSLYVSYYSPRNLFFLGDYGPRSSFPGLSTFFFWQLPFYLHGLYLLFKKRNYGELRTFTILMLVISPIPAALTHDPFSTIRALPLVIPIIICLSISFYHIWMKLKNNSSRFGYLFFAFILITYSLLKLYSSVIVLNEKQRAQYWDYGWEEVVKVIENDTDKRLPVVIDNARAEPYSQILFYTRYNPDSYQKENFEVPFDEYYTNLTRNKDKKMGRISLRSISWKPDLEIDQYLVGDYLAISEEQIARHRMELIQETKYPDGSPAYRIVRTRPQLN